MKLDTGVIMELVRTAVRPVITLSGWASLVYMVIAEIKIPEWYWTAVVGFTSFWFASRGK